MVTHTTLGKNHVHIDYKSVAPMVDTGFHKGRCWVGLSSMLHVSRQAIFRCRCWDTQLTSGSDLAYLTVVNCRYNQQHTFIQPLFKIFWMVGGFAHPLSLVPKFVALTHSFLQAVIVAGGWRAVGRFPYNTNYYVYFCTRVDDIPSRLLDDDRMWSTIAELR